MWWMGWMTEELAIAGGREEGVAAGPNQYRIAKPDRPKKENRVGIGPLKWTRGLLNIDKRDGRYKLNRYIEGMWVGIDLYISLLFPLVGKAIILLRAERPVRKEDGGIYRDCILPGLDGPMALHGLYACQGMCGLVPSLHM
jgi:hypothetical protein